jgi:hypothetical protein
MKIIKSFKSGMALLLGVLLSLAVWAEEPVLKNGHPTSYTVVKGDTLWDIAGRFLENPWMWPEIWHANPNIEDPHLIYPGDELRMVYKDGKPMLVLENRVIKLSPTVRVGPLEDPIPSVPLDAIDSFLTSSRVLENNVLESSPYIVQGADRRILGGTGNEMYARGDFEGADNLVYSVFKKDGVYTDPTNGEYLGDKAIYRGTVKVQAVEGDVAKVQIIKSREEIAIGDRLVTGQERSVEPIFHPSSPEYTINGTIIDVEGGVKSVGVMDVIVINLGSREYIKSGNIFAIYQTGEVVRDTVADENVQLHDVRAGLALAFAVFDKVTYALVMSADRPLTIGDQVRNP